MNKNGFTLVEMLIVMGIVIILSSIAGYQWSSMQKRWTIEKEINEMYASMMETRLKAMNRGRHFFVTFGAKQYTVYEDTNPSPDGDEKLNVVLDKKVVQPQTTNPIVYSFDAAFDTSLKFDKHGFISNNGNVRFDSGYSATVDCLVIATTRINIGKWDGSTCKTK